MLRTIPDRRLLLLFSRCSLFASYLHVAMQLSWLTTLALFATAALGRTLPPPELSGNTLSRVKRQSATSW